MATAPIDSPDAPLREPDPRDELLRAVRAGGEIARAEIGLLALEARVALERRLRSAILVVIAALAAALGWIAAWVAGALALARIWDPDVAVAAVAGGHLVIAGACALGARAALRP